MFFVVVMLVVFCCCFLRCLLLLCFYVVMLLSKLEAGEKQKKGGQKVEGLPVKIKGAVIFATREIIVFFLLFGLLMFVGEFFSTIKNRGLWPIFATIFGVFWVQEVRSGKWCPSRVNKWSTFCFEFFRGTCGPLIDPRLLF